MYGEDKDMGTCPICGDRLIGGEDYIDHILCEESAACQRCGYAYEHSYGYSRVDLCGSVFQWSYRQAAEESAPILQQFRYRRYLAQRKWDNAPLTFYPYDPLKPRGELLAF